VEQPRHRTLRCAIYTRKSSEEGLERDFNSLHAQREACEAFIRSRQGEGWTLRKSHYDDGGLSDATMERRALKRYWRISKRSWSMLWSYTRLID
jgi:site-specific DNA recombinase